MLGADAVRQGRPHGGVRFILGTGRRAGLREVVGVGRLSMWVSRGRKIMQKGNSQLLQDLAGWITMGLHLDKSAVKLQNVGW